MILETPSFRCIWEGACFSARQTEVKSVHLLAFPYLWPLCFCSGSLPGYTVALCLTIAIKNKASNDEIFSILKDVPNPNQDDDDGKIQTVRLWQGIIYCVCGLICRALKLWVYWFTDLYAFLSSIWFQSSSKYTTASFFVNILHAETSLFFLIEITWCMCFLRIIDRIKEFNHPLCFQRQRAVLKFHASALRASLPSVHSHNR